MLSIHTVALYGHTGLLHCKEVSLPAVIFVLISMFLISSATLVFLCASFACCAFSVILYMVFYCVSVRIT